MGMSTYIKAYVSHKDLTYQKHKKVFIACCEAGVELPKKTAEYFGSDSLNKEVLENKLEVDIKYEVDYDDSCEHYKVMVSDIPDGTYKIVFTNVI